MVRQPPRDPASDAAVRHALRYPFGRIDGSALCINGHTWPLASLQPSPLVHVVGRILSLAESGCWPSGAPFPDGDGRRPVLAFGSNASAHALAAKVSGPVPAIAARLRDFDAVYSAHISAYGAIPAALQHSPGTELELHVLYLTPVQLAGVSASEPNYRFGELADLDLRLEGGSGLARAGAYVSRHGCLRLGGAEVALAAVSADERRFPLMSQRGLQERVRDRLAPGVGLEAFVSQAIADRAVAQQRTAALRRDASALRWPSFTEVRPPAKPGSL